jgi:mRNA interferase HigB
VDGGKSKYISFCEILIVSIDYVIQTVYYKYFLTHAEYDKEKWKNDPFF